MNTRMPRYNPSPRLSARELEILPLVATIPEHRKIAEIMGVGLRTVEAHKYSLMRKLGLHSQIALTLYAVREGYVQL